MIDEIYILHKRHSSDFPCHAGEDTAGLFCVVSYHHKIVVELGKNGFDSFAKSFVCPSRRTPIFLIQPIRDFQGDAGGLKEDLLNLGAEVSFVTKNDAIMVLPTYIIIKIMEVMYACRRHIIRMYNAAYSADCMEFITVIITVR